LAILPFLSKQTICEYSGLLTVDSYK